MSLGSVGPSCLLLPSRETLVGWERTRTRWVQHLEEAPWIVERGPYGAGPGQGCISPLGCHVRVGRSLCLATLIAPP